MKHRSAFAGVRAVTFDVGGTLLHPHPSVGAVYREIALQHDREYDAAALDDAFRAAFAHTRKNPALRDPEERERDFWRRVVGTTMHDAGAKPPADGDAYFAALWEAFSRAAHWRAFPHALETLRLLGQRGYRLGVVSNSDARFRRVLDEFGWSGCFDAIVLSSEVNAEKPGVEIFRAAEAALGITPAQALHVGDSRAHDLAGGRAAGWRVLLVRPERAPGAEDEINRLDELWPLLPGSSGA